jgi:chromosome segregation ATPase
MPAVTESAAATLSAEDRRTPLELSLHALSHNLRDVEERLRLKGERLVEIEKALAYASVDRSVAEQQSRQLTSELAQARAALAAAEARAVQLQRLLDEREAASPNSRTVNTEWEEKLALRDKSVALLQKDLAAARALATTYLESLQSTEGRRGIFQELSTALHWELEDRAARVGILEGQLEASGARTRELQSSLTDRDARIAGLEKQIAELNTSLSQRDATLRQSTGERQAELDRVLAERGELTANVSSLESKLAQVAARMAELEASSSTAQTRGEELDATNAQLRKRIDQLEAELVTVRAELQQRSVALEEAAVARGEHMARIAAEEAHVQELQGRIEEQHEFVRVLQADSNAGVARVKELEGDLRAAEDVIHRMEADLRHRSARLDELEKTNQEWRATVEEARTALTDRDSLIRRLEEETANSAVLLGAIQQRLDASGVHEIAPEGDKRLLIRSDGDSEVVHVLGRKTSVGRTPDNDLQIDAKFISRHHAVILAGPAHTIIEDLNSTNGVLVNGRRITRQTLKDGDAVMIGKTSFRFAVRPPAERRA